ncbi:MAG: efflux RND transporter permease subunit, partial [Lentisphaeria bacterium]|nr:efflux RND transporter permease subunit [Lentisphaeria bacterium]
MKSSLTVFAVTKPLLTWSVTILVLIAGIMAYYQLPRYEDPEFTIKQAQIITEYPGASPEETMQEVTDKIETAVQEMEQLKELRSKSYRGRSIVTAEMRDIYNKKSLPQIWDELRNKVSGAEPGLPRGAQKPEILDDYGDVYGAFFALTGKNVSSVRLHEFARFLQKKLLIAEDVKRIALFAIPQDVVYVSLNRERIGQLGIAPEKIFAQLKERNLVTDEGWISFGGEWLPVKMENGSQSLESLRKLVIADQNGVQITLGDLAEIRSALKDPPETMLYYNGIRAIGIGVSTRLNGNVVKTGRSLRKELQKMAPEFPAEMQIQTISSQEQSVTRAVDAFTENLIEAVIIVFAVLMLFMGLKSGILIGFVLLLTIAGTLAVMNCYSIPLQRISLGALIIALGMLVDNAIVITEAMMIRIRNGEDKLRAAAEVTGQTQLPLLGATAIAVTAFAAIGLSEDSTGEFCGSLFYVLLISLFLSWITAITITPLLCCYVFKTEKRADAPAAYTSPFFNGYRKFLNMSLHHRGAVVILLVLLLLAGMYAFTKVGKNFFPDSTRDQFIVDMRLPGGTGIHTTNQAAAEVEKYIRTLSGTTNITRCVGSGTLRFILTYAPEEPDPAFAQLLVDVEDYKMIPALIRKIQQYGDENHPDWGIDPYKFRLGPGANGAIQARFSGGTSQQLRDLAEQTMQIMRKNPNTRAIRTDWRNPVKVLQPVFSEERAGRAGVTVTAASEAIKESFEGLQIGVFRDGDQAVPIIARAPTARQKVDFFDSIMVWSPTANRMIPLAQLFDGTKIEWMNPVIVRKNRVPTITVYCDPFNGLSSTLLDELRPQIEALPLPPGCSLEWGGEYEKSRDASGALYSKIPPFAALMVLILLFMFNSVRKSLIIWICVPLAVTGVSAGLLMTGEPFGFMAMLGFLSLSGMLI